MSELSYKELQEQGVFDVPYRAFEYMKSQQAKIDELQGRIDDLKNWCVSGVECNMLSTEYNQALIDMIKILKGNKDEN